MCTSLSFKSLAESSGCRAWRIAGPMRATLLGFLARTFRLCSQAVSTGGHTLNAAGMQLFGNCVSHMERLPVKTLKELYSSLTGSTKAHRVDAVSVAALLGGVHLSTARRWYVSLNAKEWSAAFTPGHSHIKLAVGMFQRCCWPSCRIVSSVVCRLFFIEDNDNDGQTLTMMIILTTRRE